ncbi:alpha-amylase [Chlorobium sp. BLA1]|uniref:alpha-amylase family glycosyl hydrolase n=1 Tax=Candidatus Chlorobium masyuteum TaxID=2716876 RepID=UPI00142169E8|nr:alpha-amylase family glycosyl hydrolase [Candidatus Chlorobium masyuteum]NHQ60338.1 alpha-amylase [Candidatus Chlorobium masyuteum]
MQTTYLSLLFQALENLPDPLPGTTYRVPAIWTGDETGTQQVNPARYFASIINEILKNHDHAGYDHAGSSWRSEAVVYNLFVRLAAAFDHNGDGRIEADALDCGFRETGTLLKAIALLPYIKKLGANTVYLLPLTEIGSACKKGSLGSPYAIKNPRKLDSLLTEPALGLSAEVLLKAFVEAAHLLDIRVVLEFVFRTTSVDSSWIQKHPEWFYWLRDDESTAHYGPPGFDPDTLGKIYSQIERHDMQNLPAPSSEYRDKFVSQPVTVTRNDGGLHGSTADGSPCKVATAFSDWPPDDKQPPWSDVTYLKMHTHEAFNYIAYNTIRMYDSALDNPETFNTALWDEIADIIPSFQESYNIDGAMIDMGHALPSLLKRTIVRKAREKRADFAFWDENFDPSPSIREEGFDAVFGSLPFVIHDIVFIRGLLNYLNKTGVALPFFGTGENHNTPRVCFRYPRQEAGRNFSMFIFTLTAVLPAIPFLQSGMELCEWYPVNLGLNFTDEDRELYPPEKLPLFSPFSYDWEGGNGLKPLNSYIAKILSIRSRFLDLVLSGEPGSMTIPYVSEPELFAVMRSSGAQSLLFVGNSNLYEERRGTLEFSMQNSTLTELIGGETHSICEHKLEISCKPGACMLFELPDTQ